MTAAFLDALRAAGLEPVKPLKLVDGKLERFRVVGDKAGSCNGWAVFHHHPTQHGAFGSWKTGESHTWHEAKPSTLDPAARAELQRQLRAMQQARAEEDAKVREDAATKAARLWEKARPATDAHPYLMAKQVRAYGIRQLREMLVIPARDEAGRLHTLQFIGADGAKRFLTGGRIRGCYCAIGRPIDVLLICEGYATAATLFHATGHATAAAFSAGNLEPVARALHAKFPRLALVLAADNDHATPGNPGLTAALAAARAVGGRVAVPTFPEVAHG
jgi:putative DNA primase/helicase